MTTESNKIVNGLKWSAVERFSVQGVQFGIGIILARLLTPADFGIIGMLTIFIAISQTFIDSGFSNALIRKQDRTDDDNSTAFYFNLAIGFICYIILYCLSPYIASFYSMPILKDVLRLLALSLVINSTIIVQIALLSSSIDFKTQAYINLSSSFFSGMIGIALAFLGYGVWSLVYQQLCRSFINMVLYWFCAKWKPIRIFSLKSFRSLFGYGSKILLSGLLNTFYVNITSLLIGKFYSSSDLGNYERGKQMSALPIDNIVLIFQRVTFPVFSKLQNDNTNLTEQYRKYMKVSSCIIFFIAFLLITLAKPIILLLLTSKWEEAIILMQLYCFATMFDHVTRLNLNLLQAKGRSDLFLKLEIIKKILSLCLIVLALPFGIIAINIALIIYSQIAIYINTYYSNKLFGITYISQIYDFGKYFISSVFAWLPAFILVQFNAPFILSIFLGVALALFLYVRVLLKNDGTMMSILRVIQSERKIFNKI